jgi:hypothetical protein
LLADGGLNLAVSNQMNDANVEQLLDDLRLTNLARYELVQALRKTIRAVAPDVSERVMYGGFMFTGVRPFCGVFAYAEHVSLEFGQGSDLDDKHGVLEGQGKFRRHIKIHAVDDIKKKRVRDYVAQAFGNSEV